MRMISNFLRLNLNDSHKKDRVSSWHEMDDVTRKIQERETNKEVLESKVFEALNPDQTEFDKTESHDLVSIHEKI